MSQWAYIRTDDNQLINLYQMQAIWIAKIEPEQEAPEGHTHELLCADAQETSYRILTGPEDVVQTRFDKIASALEVNL